MAHDAYIMRISRLKVEKLGVRLYDKVSAVIAELISNSYDADATRVVVTAPMGQYLASKAGGQYVTRGPDLWGQVPEDMPYRHSETAVLHPVGSSGDPCLSAGLGCGVGMRVPLPCARPASRAIPSGLDEIHEGQVDLDADPVPPAPLGRQQCGAGSGVGVQHEAVRAARDGDSPPRQRQGHHGRMVIGGAMPPREGCGRNLPHAAQAAGPRTASMA